MLQFYMCSCEVLGKTGGFAKIANQSITQSTGSAVGEKKPQTQLVFKFVIDKNFSWEIFSPGPIPEV